MYSLLRPFACPLEKDNEKDAQKDREKDAVNWAASTIAGTYRVLVRNRVIGTLSCVVLCRASLVLAADKPIYL